MTKHIFNTWYPIAFSDDIKMNKSYAISLLNEPLVIFRDVTRRVAVLQDRCPHRSTPLSLGKIQNGKIECPYHGWQFDGEGKCQHIPSLLPDKTIPPYANAIAKPVLEKHSIIWIALLEEPCSTQQSANIDECFDTLHSWTDADTIRFNYSIDINIPHELMIENLLDPSHLPFAHDGTISKRNKAAPIDFNLEPVASGLAGQAITYYKDNQRKQTFYFHPPFTVYFDLFFKKSAIRQIHYCLPLTKTSMRLNSIFYYKNMKWLKWIPGINRLQQRMSRKIVNQDIAMLTGQYNNLQLKAKPWNQAVSADKLAMNYRQWFNKISTEHQIWFEHF